MGFYLKKGFNIGPVRINLSKSGVGVSVGGKGLRFGSGLKGNYVHAGRGGLYYRRSLSAGWGIVIVIVAVVAVAVYYALKSGVISVNL